MDNPSFDEQLRCRTCCFTGHRPEKLRISPTQVQSALAREILLAIDAGCDRFITGMSRGVDLWAAEEVLRHKARNPRLQLIAAVPYEGFEARWNPYWQEKYRQVLSQCDVVHIFSRNFSYDSFSIRNCYMVDHADRVIAVYNGTHGGTRNTILYARRLNRTVRMIRAAQPDL